MTQGLLNLPLQVPWKQIAVSPDMIDTNFCDKRFPFAWRPSIAIFVFEPPPDDVSEHMCGERLTYIKVTVTITGYQPTREETDKAYGILSKLPPATLKKVLDNYFACYGVLLNVSVFPHTRIIRELEPKSVAFADHEVRSELPNPFQSDDFTLQGPDGPNVIVNLATDGAGAQLSIRNSLSVTFPTAAKVRAKVVQSGRGIVTMEVLAGGVVVDTKTSDTQPGRTQTLESVEREGIDQIILRSSEGAASLVEVTAFFAKQIPISLNHYPHIIAFEPKTRDLYQAATDSGEVLTASKSGVNTDKTLTHIDSTESSFNYGVKVPVPISAGVNAEISGSVSRKRTDTDEDRWSVQTDASRERRETQGTTTQLSQMYNLLTGYYAGTNRAAFLMLPRPHVLQATDHRTFIQGLRVIEGIQEFLLIVSRPTGMDSICIEAQLETGHFPEGEDPIEPPVEFEESFEEFSVNQVARGRAFSADCANIEDSQTSTFTISGDKVIDRRPDRKDGQQGDPGHPGVKEVANNSNERANDTLKNYNYRAISDTTVSVFGRICGRLGPFINKDAVFDRTYRVLTRSPQAKPPTGEPHIPPTNLIITTRNLCVCMRSGDPCPEVIPQPIRPGDLRPDSVVDELVIQMSPALGKTLRGGSRMPGVKELIAKIQSSMLMSWRQPRRYPAGEIGFLETDFFKDQIRRSVPEGSLRKRLAAVDELPEPIRRALGQESSVTDLLELDLSTFAKRTGLSVREAAQMRMKILVSL